MAALERGHYDGVSEDIRMIGYCARGLWGTFGSLPKLLPPPSLAHCGRGQGGGCNTQTHCAPCEVSIM